MGEARRKQVAIVVMLAILGLGGGAGFRAWRLHRAGGATEHPDRLFAGARFSDRAAALWGRLLSALERTPARTFTSADLVSLLSGRRSHPAGNAFAADFRGDPRLMEIWDEALGAPGGLETDRLLHRLSDSRAFAELLSRYSEDPSFRDLAASFASELGTLAAARSEAVEAEGLARGARRSGPSRGGRSATETAPLDWQPAVLAAAGPASAPAPRVAAAPKPLARPDGPADESRVTRAPEPGAPREAADPHGVDWKIKNTIVKAGPDKNAVLFLESLFVTMDKANRDALIALCADQGICDPITACASGEGLYAACGSACKANPKCSLTFPARRPMPRSAADTGGPRGREHDDSVCFGDCDSVCRRNPGAANCDSWRENERSNQGESSDGEGDNNGSGGQGGGDR